VKQQQILAAARQGNSQAIAMILNRAFSPQGIRAKTTRKGDCFYILLEANRVPDATLYCQLVWNCMVRLAVPEVRSLHIYGQQIGQSVVWGRRLQLRSTVVVPVTVSRPAAASVPVPHPQPPRRFALAIPVLTLTSVSFVLGAGSSFLSAKWQAASSSIAPPTPSPVTPPKRKPSTLPPITLKAVGDIVPGTNFPDHRLPENQGRSLFQSVRSYLQGADVLFGNFESTLTDYPNTAKDISRGMTFAFRTPPAYAQRLQEAGFDVLSVANNHSMDFAEPGFADTIRAIEQAGMQAVGKKGQIVYRQVKERTIAWIGFSYLEDHNSLHNLTTAKTLVKTAQQKAAIVVISVHAGAEGTDAIRTQNVSESFFGEDRGNLVQFSHTLIDAGADLVLGHGPHVPRAIELYKGKLIAYSLGNFLGYRTLATEGALGTSLILQVHLDVQGNFISGKIIPVYLDAAGIPHVDQNFRSVRLIRELTQIDFPQTRLKIDRGGRILKLTNSGT
jgi:poly-gamma-glutamate synthesis protein (capsule biosynthesis protein)